MCRGLLSERSRHPRTSGKRWTSTMLAVTTAALMSIGASLFGPASPAAAANPPVIDIGTATGCTLATMIKDLKGTPHVGYPCGSYYIYPDILYDIELTSDIVLNDPLPTIDDGITVDIGGNGHTITHGIEVVIGDQGNPFRLFTVTGNATLSITDAVLEGGDATGADGGRGTRGSQLCYTTTDGAVTGACIGGPGGDGGSASGGAIYASHAKKVSLTSVVLTGNSATAGDGGWGGAGGTGGVPKGAFCKRCGDPGYGGGAGGAGGDGGDALGGAIYAEYSTLSITDSVIENNSVTGGDGGGGGDGGDGDNGGQGADATCSPDQPGGDGGQGGTGGDSGAGGDGGTASGAAIYAVGGTTSVTATTIVDNDATAGDGAASGVPGAGGAGGKGGDDRLCQVVLGGGTGTLEPPGKNGADGNAGNDRRSGAGGSALGAAVYFDGINALSNVVALGGGPGGAFTMTTTTVAKSTARPGAYGAGWTLPGCPDVLGLADKCNLWTASQRDTAVGSAVASTGDLTVRASTITDNTTQLASPRDDYRHSPLLDAGLVVDWYQDFHYTLAQNKEPFYPYHTESGDLGPAAPRPTVTSSVLGNNTTVDADGAHLPTACRSVVQYDDANLQPLIGTASLHFTSGGHNIFYGSPCTTTKSTDHTITDAATDVLGAVGPVTATYPLPTESRYVGTGETFRAQAAIPFATSDAVGNGGLCSAITTDQRGVTLPTGEACDIGAIYSEVPEPVNVDTPSQLFDQVNTSYSQPLEATGGTGVYTWKVASGTLPPGLSLGDARLHGSPSTVGTYTFTLKATDSNGQSGSKSITMVVTQASKTVTVSGSMVYGGTPSFKAYADGKSTPLHLDGHVSCAETTTGQTVDSTLPVAPASDDFEYHLKNCTGPSTDADGNYFLTYVGGTFAVTQATVTATVTGEMTYGTPDTTMTVTAQGLPDSGAELSSTTVTCTSADGHTINATLDAGTYSVDKDSCATLPTLTGPDAGNYQLAWSYSTFTVDKYQAFVVLQGIKRYGSTDTTWTVKSTTPSTLSLTGSASCSRILVNNGQQIIPASITADTALGEHPIDTASCKDSTIAITDNADDYVLNYRGRLDVPPGIVDVTIGGSMTYRDSAHATFTATATPPSDVAVTSSKLSCGKLFGGTAIDDTLDVGSAYHIDASSCTGVTLGGDKGGDYVPDLIGGVFTVSPAALTVKITGQMTYGDLNSVELRYGVPGGLPAGDVGPLGGTLQCRSVDSGVPISATLAAGDHTLDSSGCSGLKLKGSLAPNYHIVYDTGGFTVRPASLPVTISGQMTYGESTPTFTATAPALPSSGVALSTPTGCALTGGIAPGATTAAGDSYTVDASTCRFDLTGALADDYTPALTNGTFTVNKAPVTVTASSPTVVYGDPVPTITPSYSALVNGDQITGPQSVLTAKPHCSTLYEKGDDVGTYDTSCSGAAAKNYTFSYHDGQVSVSRAGQQITFEPTELAYPTYGDSYPIRVKTTGGTPTFAVDKASAAVCTLSGTTVTLTGVGICTVHATLPKDADHTAAHAQQSITVHQAKVTVTAPSLTIAYGAAVPALTPSYSGFVNHEGPSVLTTAPHCTTSYAQGDEVGRYRTGCTGAAATNYTFSDVGGWITVTKAPQTITFTLPAVAKVGARSITLSATASSGLDVHYTATGNCSVKGSTLRLGPVGTCTVIATQPGDKHYAAAEPVVRTLTIPQPPAITSSPHATLIEGVAGSVALTATGNPAPTLTRTGTLPPGMRFADNGDGIAAITGTPTKPGTFHLMIHADNGVRPAATQRLTLDVVAPPAVPLPPSAPAPTQVGSLTGVPPHTTPGQVLHLIATGFAGHAAVVIGIYSAPRTLAHATADASGEVRVSVTIPKDLRGRHTVVAAGTGASGTPLYLRANTDITASSTGTGSGKGTGTSGNNNSGSNGNNTNGNNNSGTNGNNNSGTNGGTTSSGGGTGTSGSTTSSATSSTTTSAPGTTTPATSPATPAGTSSGSGSGGTGGSNSTAAQNAGDNGILANTGVPTAAWMRDAALLLLVGLGLAYITRRRPSRH